MINLVYCYASEDVRLAAELEKHLTQLRRVGQVVSWHPGMLLGGQHRDAVIARRIEEADVVLLLLSVDFLASSTCYDEQLQKVMERHYRGAAQVIPIRLRDADYSGAPFEDIQALPRHGRTIRSFDDRDPAWAEIAREIRTSIEAISATSRAPQDVSCESRPSYMAVSAATRSFEPGYLPWLEARFYCVGTQWHVQLAPESGRLRERPFRDPRRVEDIFTSIFDEDQDADLIRHPWRLRLRPKDLEPETELPALSSWAHLYHPEDECHILDRGWTVTELTVRPRRVECSGTVAVLGAESLFRSLRQLLGPRVVQVFREAIPVRSILVVQGVAAHEVQQTQEQALQANCALLVWADVVAVSRSGLAEVLTLKNTREPLSSWLVRFVSRLVGGIDPERAFAYAGLGGPPEDRVARWLRGGFSGWSVDSPESAVALDPRWFVRLDRSKQESEINRLTHHLVLPNNKRRIQVVITTGPEGSGLELFCHRPPLISPEVPRIPVVEWDLTWTEAPSHQIQRLQQRLNARRPTDLPERLLMEATRIHEQQVGVRGTRVLFWGRHETACFSETVGLRHVTIDDLHIFMVALQELSVQIARWDMRLLLHLPFQGTADPRLEKVQYDDRWFRVNVLPPLPSGVPEDELGSWMRDAGLSHDQVTLEEMMALPYDTLIQWLVDRYPELRSV